MLRMLLNLSRYVQIVSFAKSLHTDFLIRFLRHCTTYYVLQHDPLYLNPPIGTIHAAVWDVTSADGLPPNLAPGSADLVIMVFVMSALHPDEWGRAVGNVHKVRVYQSSHFFSTAFRSR